MWLDNGRPYFCLEMGLWTVSPLKSMLMLSFFQNYLTSENKTLKLQLYYKWFYVFVEAEIAAVEEGLVDLVCSTLDEEQIQTCAEGKLFI